MSNQHRSDAMTATRRSALVLGGGFAGLTSAIRLAQGGLDVTLVANRKALFVYPTSIWVVTGEQRIEQSQLDLEELARQHGFKFLFGEVQAIDAAAHAAIVDGQRLAADTLVLAMGAARRKLPGIEHTTTLWGEPSDTELVGDRLATLLERGSGRIAVGFGGAPDDPTAVRGGPAFEVLFNIDHLLRRHGVRERFSITAFAPMENPGVRMGAAAAASVHDFLGRAGIERRFGKSLSGFDAEGVRFNDGSRLDADLVVFIPGGTGHPVLKDAQLPLNPAGFVRTDDRGQVVGFPHIYAVGDVADLRGPDFRAKQGHVAELMAEVAAADILATSKGAPRPEGYEARVDLLCLMDTGNGAALIHRTRQRERFIVLPWVGHQLKKAWAYYYRFQRLPLGAFAAWLWRELGTEIASWLGGKPTPRHLPAPHLLKLRK